MVLAWVYAELSFGVQRSQALYPPPVPCPFLPSAPPKVAESEEETPETPQKNSNRKGKGKKSKKVQNTPWSCRGPLDGGGSSCFCPGQVRGQ